MTVNKRSKQSRMRGSHTHGWGAMKKHRGSGNRGGVGRAGSGKRGDAKKPSIWKSRYFGKFGFTSHAVHVKTINVGRLEQSLNALISAKAASVEGDVVKVDLKKAGVQKLLGSGKVTKKLNVSVPYASKKAQEMIKNAGGEVVLG